MNTDGWAGSGACQSGHGRASVPASPEFLHPRTNLGSRGRSPSLRAFSSVSIGVHLWLL